MGPVSITSKGQLVSVLQFTLTLALSHDGRGDKSVSVQFAIFKLTEYWVNRVIEG